MAPSAPRRPRILAAVPWNTPHLVPLFDELARRADLDVVRACLRPLPARRAALGWSELAEDAPWLAPWRRPDDRLAYWRELAGADVALLPGPFQLRSMPLHHARRRVEGPLLTWSERFLDKRPRTALDLAPHRAILRALDGPRTHLLAIGGGALEDYTSLGLATSPAWRFAYVVDPGFAAAASRPAVAADAPLRMLCVAELSPLKGLDLLVEALASTPLRRLPWTCDVIGGGPDGPMLAARAEASGLGERVRWHGALPRERCLAAFRGGDVLVVPSRFDGWGAVVNEAFEAGLAVVATSAVGASQLVRPGENGLVVPRDSADALAEALAALAEDPRRARVMGAAGPATIAAWRPAAVAARLAAVCRSAAGLEPWPDYDEGPLSRLRPPLS